MAKPMRRSGTEDTLRQPFYATGAELELYQQVFERWRTLSTEQVLTEAARLFHLAVAMADDAVNP